MKKIAAIAALALASSVALPVVNAGAGVPTDDPTVSITVSMDLPGDSDGPVVFEVDDVPIGDGPELSGDDLVSNPSGWCGSLFVDVDLEAGLIIITPDEACDFETADVTIEGDSIGTIELVSDDLWLTEDTEDDEEQPLNTDETSTPSEIVEMDLAYGNPVDGVAAIEWATSVPGWSLDMDSEGAAVFSFGPLVPPTTPTTAAPTTTSTAAAAAAVTPRFAG